MNNNVETDVTSNPKIQSINATNSISAMNFKVIFAVVIFTLLAGIAGGYWIANMSMSGDSMEMNESAESNEKPVKAKEKKVLFYRNPMNPAITSPTFQQDEMGMDYIPVYAGSDNGDNNEPSGTVKIDPVVINDPKKHQYQSAFDYMSV